MRGCLTELAIGSLELSPAFDPAETVYSLGEIETGSAHVVTAETDWPGATLQISGFNCQYNSLTGKVTFYKTMTPGPAYGALSVKVKYRDPQDSAQHTRTYTVNFDYPT